MIILAGEIVHVRVEQYAVCRPAIVLTNVTWSRRGGRPMLRLRTFVPTPITLPQGGEDAEGLYAGERIAALNPDGSTRYLDSWHLIHECPAGRTEAAKRP